MKPRHPKEVLITGCSSGIGHYCAYALHQEGYRVFATARSMEDVRRLREEGLWACRLDLNESDSIREGVERVLHESGGRLYALFNNGAYGQPGAVEDLGREVLREQFETNLFGTHELTCRILPVMRAQGYGRIVQNSSVLGFAALRFRGAYNASKFALEGLSDTLRLELEGSGIYVVLIEPGPIRSRFRAHALRKFLEHIDREHSVWKEAYAAKLEALRSDRDAPFTLGPQAVYRALKKALEHPRPAPRYRVTVPTSLFWYLKRLLPTRAMDALLRRVE